MANVKADHPQSPQVIGWRDAAREYGIKPWPMYQAFTSGAVPSFFLNGKLLCLRSELEKWLMSLSGKKVTVEKRSTQYEAQA
jgi:hypothetical protein